MTDPLDMHQYRIDKLPKRTKGGLEKWLALSGPWIALAAFILLGFFIHPSFLQNISPDQLSSEAKNVFDKIGEPAFIRSNTWMLAIFAASLILWMTEAIPNYLTSLILIISVVWTGILSEKEAFAQLGHPVMWLNIMSFVLASMLVSTGLAKRFALWFLLRFGKSAGTIFLSFLVINLVLSAFISATTAKAAILLPIFMVVAAIYGARGNDQRNNFGRSIVLQNLLYINLGASGFLTGSGANLLAISLIAGATGSQVFFSDWLISMFPMAIILMFFGYIMAMRVFFPLKAEERLPQIEGGMERLKLELKAMGPLTRKEGKAIVLFTIILLLWSTDRWHGISPTAVAFLGGILALLPGVGIIQWNDVDIPWHLMLFSAGAYTLGAALAATDLPSILVNAFFDHLGLDKQTPFWLLYLLLTALMLFSALLFQSKTMRAMIFVPMALGVAHRFGYYPLSLALPVAFMIEHVYVLPFNSKPAALLYETGHYSLSETFRLGISIMIFAWFLNIIAGETWFRFLGITPHGVFNLF